ncbi:MAG TPA: TetR/AcrR family transcriptional regulator [Acidimicrobiia bacterium]
MPTRQRAEPLAPEQRRRAIVEAIIPLLLDQAGTVTTAQMAEAAGVAEGTIFKVFPDKTALLHEALTTCFDPESVLDQLAAIEHDLPFEIKLRKAAAIVLKRADRVHALAAVLRSLPPSTQTDHRKIHERAIEANSLIFWGLTRIFQEESERLAVEPARAAAAFRGLLHAVSFPLSDPDELIAADEAIDILLHGVVVREVS